MSTHPRTPVATDSIPPSRHGLQRLFASLHSRLVILACATVLPFALCAAAAFAFMLHQQKVQVEQATLGMARALAAAVDAQMQRTVAALDAFALAQSLGDPNRENLQAAHVAARQLRQSRSDWRGVLLARTDGSIVFGSESPFVGAARQTVEKGSLADVVRLQTPVVGPMTPGFRGGVGYTVRVPVISSGEVRYVLTAIVSTDSILEVLQRQQVPPDWVVSVFDSNLKRVARSRDNGRYFGTDPGATLGKMLAAMGQQNEAVGITTTLEGEEAYTAIARILGTRWKLSVGASTRIVNAALWRSASLYSSGLLLSLVLGGIAFFVVSRSITSHVNALHANAVALGQGRPLTARTQGLSDFDAVATALCEAAQLRAEHDAERESLLQSEKEARTVAERAQHRIEILLTATSSLSHSLDEKRTLATIASAVVPALADMCRIDLLEAHGKLAPKLIFHRDPARVAAIEDAVRAATPLSTTAGSMPWAVATALDHVHHFDPADIAQIKDPAFQRFAEVTRMRAICVIPLIARGRVIGAMAALQAESNRRFEAEDVTALSEIGHRVALALDNVRLHSDCAKALDEAQVAGRAKDEFLAMLGHELRNPLAPILSALEVIKLRDSKAFLREREVIERQAEHLSHLVDDLLDISRVIAGRVHLQHERVSLQAVVARALEVTQPLFEKRPAPLLQHDGEEIAVRGDFLRLAQVVTNLLNNAARFSEPDQPVKILLEHGGGQARLTVEDRGIGISEDFRELVFDRFVQGPQDLQRAKGGLGLGLTIARSIVELHGGTIAARDGRDGTGTAVTMTLPLLHATEATDSVVARALDPKPLRILLVDDNADAAEMLAALLADKGHDVQVAVDAEGALADFQTFRPTACILDIGLPGMDGYELARRLREQGAVRLHLIAVTGYGQYSDREKAMRAGFDDHMTKPIKFEALEALLEKASRATSV